VSKPKEKRCWARYDEAQENEYPEVIRLVAEMVDTASLSYELVRRDAAGRGCSRSDDIAKFVLAQQYDGRSDRVAMGYLRMIRRQLRAHGTISYKTLENAYGDADVIAILNDVFFLTQLPVKDLEHDFSIDGTCHPTTIKENWESCKDEILRLAGKRASSRKERKRREFEKTVLAVGTTFKIIASFARTRSPFSNESPYLKPLLHQVAELYAIVVKVCMDSGFLSRENCTLIEEAGAMPRILPKKGVSLRAKGSPAWRRMMLEFVEDTQEWLRKYHSRSIVETVNSTLKRLFGPLRKKLVERKATEILARICVYNIRQLVYLKYTKDINPNAIGPITPRPGLQNCVAQ
jgi:transposase